jgi:hypothetical protein
MEAALDTPNTVESRYAFEVPVSFYHPRFYT